MVLRDASPVSSEPTGLNKVVNPGPDTVCLNPLACPVSVDEVPVTDIVLVSIPCALAFRALTVSPKILICP